MATAPTTSPATTATAAGPGAGPAPAPAPPAEAGLLPPEAGAREERYDRADRAPHPEFVPAVATWPGYVVAAIAGLFLFAAVVGPLVRMLAPAEVPPAQSHDEPPGTSGRHGKSGTLNPE